MENKDPLPGTPAKARTTGVELRAQIWRRTPRALPIAGIALILVLGALFTWLSLAGDPEDAEQVARVKLDSSRPDPSDLLRRGDNDGDLAPSYENYASADADFPNDAFEHDGRDVDFKTIVINPPETAPAAAPPPDPQPARSTTKPSRPELSEKGPYGPLPAIAKNGKRPGDVYARAFTPPKNKPAGYVAILIGGMGLSQSASANALEKLPADISLSFAPYGSNLNSWVKEARARGHEVALELPLEPFNYPDNDPGPYTLLTSSSWEENQDRLSWLLSRTSDYALVTNYQGAKFTASDAAMTPFLKAVSARGLVFIDNGGSPRSRTAELASSVNLTAFTGDRIIDGDGSAPSVDAALNELEALARQNGVALGIGSAFPVTVERLAAWSATLRAKNIILIPVSGLKHVKSERS